MQTPCKSDAKPMQTAMQIPRVSAPAGAIPEPEARLQNNNIKKQTKKLILGMRKWMQMQMRKQALSMRERVANLSSGSGFFDRAKSA